MKRVPWVVLAWVGALAVAPIVWWLVGDVSEPFADKRTWAAPQWLVDNTHLLGVAGFVAILSVAAVEFVGLRLHFFAKHLLVVFVPLACAAALAAFSYRVMTALSGENNIGAVVALLLGMPLAACLAVVHLYMLRDELKREHFVHLR